MTIDKLIMLSELQTEKTISASIMGKLISCLHIILNILFRPVRNFVQNLTNKIRLVTAAACCIGFFYALHFFNTLRMSSHLKIVEIALSSHAEEITCKLPRLVPFDESILKFIKIPKPLDCVAEHTIKGGNKIKYSLLFETDNESNLIMLEHPSLQDSGFESCCYRNYSRTSDNGVSYSRICTNITSKKTNISPEHEFIVIYCQPIPPPAAKNASLEQNVTATSLNSLNTTLKSKPKAVDLLHFVRIKPRVEERIKNNSRANSNSTQISVLILGLDSISHMNFLRMMPKSHEYLTEELLALSMDGYVKVADNTFPNIVPALSGLKYQELSRICWNSSGNGYFDKCPFIWKDFSNEGYRTSYAEDATEIGIFNYAKQGFKDQPTDYYLRTLTHHMQILIGHVDRWPNYLCYGPRSGFSVLLENIRKFVVAMGKDRKYFQFTWVTSLFHGNSNHAAHGDEELRDTLEWLKKGGHLANTALILMSDHGDLYGPIRSTLQGRIEERMPFLYFSFPKWFHEKYTSAIENMKLNRNRLSTPFDFHETLKDLLFLGNISIVNIEKRLLEIVTSDQMPRGISLFLPIPTTRTCDQAGIEPHYCVCNPALSIPSTDKLVKEAATFVVKELNKMLNSFPQCSGLSLKAILSAQVMSVSANSSSSATMASSSPLIYIVSLSTVPGNATFEATLRFYIKATHPAWNLAGDISRTNMYGNQSRCVTDYRILKYCFCK